MHIISISYAKFFFFSLHIYLIYNIMYLALQFTHHLNIHILAISFVHSLANIIFPSFNFKHSLSLSLSKICLQYLILKKKSQKAEKWPGIWWWITCMSEVVVGQVPSSGTNMFLLNIKHKNSQKSLFSCMRLIRRWKQVIIIYTTYSSRKWLSLPHLEERLILMSIIECGPTCIIFKLLKFWRSWYIMCKCLIKV